MNIFDLHFFKKKLLFNRMFGHQINQLYVEKNCQKAVGLTRSLLATIKSSNTNWNEMKSAGCGMLFRTVRSCITEDIPR